MMNGGFSNLTPLEYLACADREWEAGNHQEAAGLLWEGTKATFVALAEERGLGYDEHMIDLAKALEAEGKVFKGYYRDNLITAKLMRSHSEMDVLEGADLESTFKLARKFVLEQQGGQK